MNLFGKDTRPVFNEEMRTELAELIAKDIFEWCKGETPLQDIIEDSKSILEYHSEDDGYTLAKAFEDKYYSPDSEMVELLNDVSYRKHEIIRKAVKKWVVEDKIEAPFKVGTTCIVKYGNKKVEGTITGTYSETAEYQVAIPSEGMPIDGSTRVVIKYENVELITQSI